ncbi:MAG: HD-GYP domain-containing protein [Magnetococcales bacterium]|nr:HD-GYP domain-containing protein [Magnetococcales bacterium]
METTEIDVTAQQLLEAQLKELLDEPESKSLPGHSVLLAAEMGTAAEIKNQAKKLVANVLEDARLGRQVSIRPIQAVSTQMMESLLKNDDALLNLSLIKCRDDYLFQHSVNVGVFIMAVTRSLGFDDAGVIAAGVGGMMHDIGMVRIPESIYHKPGKLTDAELRQIQKHVELGYRLLVRTPGVPEIALVIAGTHHGRQDGSGYAVAPVMDKHVELQHLSAIIDMYDAMTSPRPYRRAWSATNALRKIHEMSIKQRLNAKLVHTFIHHIGIYPLGSLVRLENQLLGVVIQTNRANLLYPTVRLIIDGHTGKKIDPRDIDLMAWKDKQQGYTVVASEHPEDWGIDPKTFLPNSNLYS